MVRNSTSDINNGSSKVPTELHNEDAMHQLCERIEREAETSYKGLRIADVLKEIKCVPDERRNLEALNQEEYIPRLQLISKEAVRRFAGTLRHLHGLESFSCIRWAPQCAGDLFPVIAASCPNFRKLEFWLDDCDSEDDLDFEYEFDIDRNASKLYHPCHSLKTYMSRILDRVQ